MAIFKIVLHNPPQDSELWFDYEDAVNFERSEYPDRDSANEALMEFCIGCGTDIEENYEDDKPRAIHENDYAELYGEDSMVRLFW